MTWMVAPACMPTQEPSETLNCSLPSSCVSPAIVMVMTFCRSFAAKVRMPAPDGNTPPAKSY